MPTFGNRNHPLRRIPHPSEVVPQVDKSVDYAVWGDEQYRFHVGGTECLDRMAAEITHLPEPLTAVQRKRAKLIASELSRKARRK